ncbi:MAG: ribonuclease P protein component [Polyangia bacterium]
MSPMLGGQVGRFGLPRTHRVRKRGAFVEIQRQGKKTSGAGLLMFVLPQRKPGPARLGVTVSRRVGGSVVRNRVRRLVREVFRLNPTWFPPGLDVVFVARPTAGRDLSTIATDIQSICRRAGRSGGAR